MKKFTVFTEIAAINKASQVIRRVVRDLKPMAAAARNVNRAWKRTAASGGALLGRMRNIGLVAGVAAGAVFGFAKKSAGSAAKIRDTADKLGISVEEFQKFIFVANQSGIATQNLGTGMQRLNRRIADAAGGKNKELAALFQKLGISLRDADGNLRTSADLMPELAEGFKANENAAIRTKMAFALFDTEGVDFLRFLSKGAPALLKMMNAAKNTGQVMGGETLRGVAALDDRFTSLAGTVRTLGIAITGELAGGIDNAITAIQNFLGDGEKKEKLLASIAAAAAAAKAATIGFSDAVSAALPVIRNIVDALGGWENIGIAVAALFGVKLVAAIASFVASLAGLGKALLLLAFSNPFTAIAAAVAVAAVAVITNWDSVKVWMKPFWAGFTGTMDRATDSMVAGVDKMTALAGTLSDAWHRAAGSISRVWGTIKAAFAGGALTVLSAVRDVVATLPDFATKGLGLDVSALNRAAASLRGFQLNAEAQAAGAGAASVGRQGLRGLLPGLARQTVRTEVVIRAENMPRGTRIEVPRGQADKVETDVGFSLAGGGA